MHLVRRGINATVRTVAMDIAEPLRRGGQLRIIADITDPDLICKILDHVQQRAPPQLPPQRALSDTTYPDLFAERQ